MAVLQILRRHFPYIPICVSVSPWFIFFLYMSKKTLVYFLVMLFVAYCITPFLWQFLTSLKPDSEITRLPPVFPESITAGHYRAIFEGYPFLRLILNSLIVSSSTTLLSLIIGSLSAFALSKLNVSYKGLFLGFVLSVSMFPPIATVSPLLIIRFFGLRDT